MAKKSKQSKAISKSSDVRKSESAKPGPKYTTAYLIARLDEPPENEQVKYSDKAIALVHEYAVQGLKLRDIAQNLGIHETTLSVWRAAHPKFNDALIRGQMIWLRSLPARLIKHMGSGFHYNTFAYTIGRHRQFLYDLEKIWPYWLEAKQEAIDGAQYFHEQLMVRQATGQLTVELGEYVKTYHGKVVKDDEGKPLVLKKVGQANFSDRMLEFMAKKKFDDYADKKEDADTVFTSELADALSILDAEDQELRKRALAKVVKT